MWRRVYNIVYSTSKSVKKLNYKYNKEKNYGKLE